MDDADIQLTISLVSRLPPADVAKLAHATSAGLQDLHRLTANSASDKLRSACQQLVAALNRGADPRALSGALLGADHAARHTRGALALDVVWTGPTSNVTASRLTWAVISAILGEAQRSVLLIGYAVQSEPSVAKALEAAVSRGAEVTLLLERSIDNPNYAGTGSPFPSLPARRLAWPAEHRPTGGAALHAKVLVVDRSVALVGSANVTGWALERNLECGILVRGGPQPAVIHEHIDALVSNGSLVPI
ncbi:DISARM system phospholipase D-like protein DrmC [Couchioplanes caeruleus]|uniref:PLD phosphodiesterase domain-containing protein n=2 Tax=Couchioplanes caeruleus TaxID=56438 RepID=A0A1K0FD35_9ACTN|nr:DISARM system phospholipase D-like protein DrmC [Couchioplanes caeruleus]OJF10749.1 hypothetical protein BG844_30265 [Couchioplanes caeruleus subsp. caeruleus]ROP28151.1 phospholipase D-like protein [Couchioplanes caeruleus]